MCTWHALLDAAWRRGGRGNGGCEVEIETGGVTAGSALLKRRDDEHFKAMDSYFFFFRGFRTSIEIAPFEVHF